MAVIQTYGPFRVTIYAEQQRAVITRPFKPGALAPGQLELVRDWMMEELATIRGQGYMIVDESTREARDANKSFWPLHFEI